MDLGNTIFLKYPISKAERIRQADRTDQDALTAAFYIRRVIGRTEIKISDSLTVAAYVVHSAAYDTDGTVNTSSKSKTRSNRTLPFVLGGDFNELPLNA